MMEGEGKGTSPAGALPHDTHVESATSLRAPPLIPPFLPAAAGVYFANIFNDTATAAAATAAITRAEAAVQALLWNSTYSYCEGRGVQALLWNSTYSYCDGRGDGRGVQALLWNSTYSYCEGRGDGRVIELSPLQPARAWVLFWATLLCAALPSPPPSLSCRPRLHGWRRHHGACAVRGGEKGGKGGDAIMVRAACAIRRRVCHRDHLLSLAPLLQADCLYGQMLAHHHGLGWLVDPATLVSEVRPPALSF